MPHINTTKDLKNEPGPDHDGVRLGPARSSLVLLLGIFQFGVAFNNYVTLTDAVRAGARKASGVAQLLLIRQATAVHRSSLREAGSTKTELGRNLSCTRSTLGRGVRRHRDCGLPVRRSSLLNWNVFSGRFSSTMKERVE